MSALPDARDAHCVPKRRHCVALLCMVIALVFGFAPIADAHTDFESSDPINGAVLAAPVSEIHVRFTAESIVAGDGFVVLTPAGDIVSPEVSVSDDGREFTLLFDPPLVNGDVGVQWSVRAGDAHPIEGTFSFTTTAPEPTIAVEPQPDPEVEPEQAAIIDPEPEPIAVAPASEAETPPVADAPAGVAGVQSEVVSAGDDVPTLDEFLNGDDDGSSAAGPVGFAGRFASQAGSLIAIGVVAFALLVSAKSSAETTVFVKLIRIAGALTIVGVLVESIGLVLSLGSVSDALFGSAGFAVLLRLVGATGLLASTVTARSGSVPTFGKLGWLLAGLLAVSFVFDGHTVSKGDRLLTGVIDLVHVAGGAVWLGGLICLLVLSLRTGSQLDPAAFVAVVVRFSVVAAIALGAVGIAGLALTVTILDSVSELWSTAWGRLLIAKVLTVTVAVAAGAYNHFVLVPELQTVSAHTDAHDGFIRTLKIEAAALAVALLVTAALVAAAS